MITSPRTAWASAGRISGSGLAMAKITGSLAIDLTIAGVSAPLEETPKKTSASTMASSRVRAGSSVAKRSLYSFIPSVRPW